MATERRPFLEIAANWIKVTIWKEPDWKLAAVLGIAAIGALAVWKV